MPINDRPPAIRKIDTNRPELLAVEIFGLVTAADIENFYGLIEAGYTLHDRIDVLMQAREIDEIDLDAGMGDDRLSDNRDASPHVRRLALVCERAWQNPLLQLAALSTDVEMRHFNVDEEADAWAWLEAQPA
ncbi:STAS/SEC14 domain-containing protein [Limoniibacter endophyticus]|uniref:STAS/SEC14 domain-containing protein n=1 Tax=Limoniibacter endophyticus TaxID=1565040 RepID=A0A8J3DK26_9HYPH|nr:STAS/SEC14 domain-containing protein [Limoniibacter endophyticus]GHC75408.1 hypothetical protein GCM10010136_25260 [Limoniibacter endophyticus]